MTLSFRLFPAQLGDLREAGADDVVILRDMRETAGRAVLDAASRVGKRAAAAFAQRVQRAVAEQTVEALRVSPRMAGEEFTFTILKKLIVLAHSASPILSPVRTLLSTPWAL